MVVRPFHLGGAVFPPSSLFGGAALVGVAFPFLFEVVLFSFLGWCRVLLGGAALSLLFLGVACFVMLFWWVVLLSTPLFWWCCLRWCCRSPLSLLGLH